MSISRTLFRAAVTLAAAFAVSVPVAEAIFRAAGAAPADEPIAIFRAFGDGNYRPKSNLRIREDWASGAFSICTDGLGLRCGADGKPAIAPGDRIDTLVLGDSQAFGLGVDYEKSVVGVMAGLAAAEGRIVGNAAVGGHYLRNQLEVGTHLHDAERLTFDRAAIFLTSRGMSFPDGYSRANVDATGNLAEGRGTIGERTHSWLRTHFAAYLVLRDAYRNTMSLKARAQDEQTIAVYRTANRARLVDGWRSELQGVKRWAAALRCRPVIVYLPESFDLDVDAMAKSHGASWEDVLSTNPFEVCRIVCAETGIGLVDTRSVLDARRAAGKPLHLRSDFHYDSETSGEVGTFVWQAISRGVPDGGR